MDTIPEFDLYRELEVDPSATADTIDAAWRSLVKRYHPDAVGDDVHARERIRRLNLAHDWLGDPMRRASYDRHRRLDGESDRWRPTSASFGAPRTQRPPDRHMRPDTAAASDRVPLWIIVLIVVAAVGLGGLLFLMVATEDSPLAPPPGSASSSTSPTLPQPSPAYDAQAEADALLTLIPNRVSGLRLRGQAAAGEALQADGRGEGTAEFVASLGRDPGDLAFAYKAAPATSGKTLMISAFRTRDIEPKVLVDAFVTHTKKRDPRLKWAPRRRGGERVWVSADGDEPKILAYVWPGPDEMFLLISDDAQLADAAIRSLG